MTPINPFDLGSPRDPRDRRAASAPPAEPTPVLTSYLPSPQHTSSTSRVAQSQRETRERAQREAQERQRRVEKEKEAAARRAAERHGEAALLAEREAERLDGKQRALLAELDASASAYFEHVREANDPGVLADGDALIAALDEWCSVLSRCHDLAEQIALVALEGDRAHAVARRERYFHDHPAPKQRDPLLVIRLDGEVARPSPTGGLRVLPDGLLRTLGLPTSRRVPLAQVFGPIVLQAAERALPAFARPENDTPTWGG